MNPSLDIVVGISHFCLVSFVKVFTFVFAFLKFVFYKYLSTRLKAEADWYKKNVLDLIRAATRRELYLQTFYAMPHTYNTIRYHIQYHADRREFYLHSHRSHKNTQHHWHCISYNTVLRIHAIQAFIFLTILEKRNLLLQGNIYIYIDIVQCTKEKLRWIAARTLSWPQPLPSVGSKLPGSHLWKIWIRMCIHICFCICIYSVSITVSIFICQYLQQSESWILWKLAESQHLQFHFFP